MHYPILTPEAAAALIIHGETLGLSGFTTAGAAKAVPLALAARARAEHAAGRELRVNVFTGASMLGEADEALAQAGVVQLRMPYQSSPGMRAAVNAGEVEYVDAHLSGMAQMLRMGVLPRVNTAIIEVCDVTDEGELTLTASLGNSAVFCRQAERIILELNTYHKPLLREVHDICELPPPPYPQPVGICTPEDRIGARTLRVDPRKIVGVVYTHQPDRLACYKEPTAETTRIGELIADFLAAEYRAGRLPGRDCIVLQSGVGNIANAALKAIGRAVDFPPIKMYTEVLTDAAL